MGKKLTYEELEKKLMERDQAETALRESEGKLRSLLDITSDWVWEVDLNGVYTYASPRVKDILGYDANEINAIKFFDFLEKEDKKATQAFFREKCRRPEPFAGRRVNQRRKDGQRVTIEVNGAPIFDKHGRLSGWCGFDKDITDRVLAEEALRESEERYRNLFENAPSGVFRAELEGANFMAANKKFAEILGYSIEELQVNQSAIKLADPKDMDRILGQLTETGIVENFEIEVITKGGEIKTCLASMKLFPKLKYLEGTLIDITERKKAEGALRKAHDKLAKSNRLLKREIEERKHVEVALRERESELDMKNESLEEMNAALRVLLKKREEDKKELEDKVLLKTSRDWLSHLWIRLKTSQLDSKQLSYA